MEYQPTIGLEIHAVLKTRTKMFCGCKNDLEEKHPNTNVCPVCLGHPGTLPTANKKAIESVIRVGLALRGTIAKRAKFDRKNYFYPDLPKGYQISQYDEPIVTGGELLGVRIRRIHLEEDAGRLVHSANSKAQSARGNERFAIGDTRFASYVDFNRAGVPLMELVTEPDFTSGAQVPEFAKELQRIFRYLDVSDADMEKGQLRIEANVSLNMGPKVELKNINSFKAVADAIDYEITRQREALEGGSELRQETRGWDEAAQRTVAQRTKEEAHDYRYFPEPDVPPFALYAFPLEELAQSIPELPQKKRERFKAEFGLSGTQAALLADEQPLADFYEAAASELAQREKEERESEKQMAKARELLYNYLTSDLKGFMREKEIPWSELKITPEHLAHLVDLIADGKIMSRQAKDILRKMGDTGLDPEEVLEGEGLHTVSDERELADVVKEIVGENPAAVADYKRGKTASVEFLVGKAMGKLKGRGDPEALRRLFERHLHL